VKPTDLLTYAVQGLFVLVSLITLVEYFRRGGRTRLLLALMLGSVALSTLAVPAAKLLGLAGDVPGRVSGVFLLAQPFILFILAGELRHLPRWSIPATLIWYACSAVLSFFFSPPLPLSVTLFVVLYFAVVEIWAAIVFLQGSRQSRGVTRWRLVMAFAGSASLGLIIVFAGLGTIAPRLMTVGQSALLAVAILCALAYFSAFATPLWLQRIWQAPEIISFTEKLSEVPAGLQIEKMVQPLLRSALLLVVNSAGAGFARSRGGSAFDTHMIGRAEADASTSGFTGPDGDAFARVMERGEPAVVDFRLTEMEMLRTIAKDRGAQTGYLVPLTGKVRKWGVLIVLLRNQPFFQQADTYLLTMMARNMAHVLEYAELLSRERDLARELEHARAQAESANHAKSDFLANMSHELRTPLNSIIGFSEILSDLTLGELNPKQQRYVGNILGSGRHLLQLINDILDLSKIEAGRVTLEYSDLDIAKTVEEVVDIVRPLAARKEIILNVQIEEGLPTLNADRAKFRQVLYNLLSNAIKFTRPQGTITLTSGLRGEGTAGQTGAPSLFLEVRDTGIGIKAEDMGRLFGKFEQLDSTYAREQQGTGLGLALTKKLVEMHGGTIWAESEGVGKGSVFSVLLPLRAAEPPVPPAPAAAETGGAPGQNLVLVIEDDPRSREILSHHIEHAGFKVASTADGSQALQMAKESKPQAITLDILLPERDGWEVLKQLKSDPATRDIPVFVISITEDRDLGLSLGAKEFFFKPVDGAKLIGALQALGPPGR
jgi:signal transduction histidine kinase